MRQFSYVAADGSFDYERYRSVQTAANKAKIAGQWAREPTIAFVAGYILGVIGKPAFGLCHGTRRGAEQAWFAKYLDCDVIGTEISDTATDFPATIQWDFHEVKPEWLCAVDFIYSNSWDHSYDPVKLFNAWVSCLRPGGLCLIEHTPFHVDANEMDPLGMTEAELVEMLTELGRAGGWKVKQVIRNRATTGLAGLELSPAHVVVRRD
ncbi:MAG: hypothetical protein WDN25_09735 [Acetobacteraceae bacterium]